MVVSDSFSQNFCAQGLNVSRQAFQLRLPAAFMSLNSKFQVSQLAGLGGVHGSVEQRFPVCLWEAEKINHIISCDLMLHLQMRFPGNC